MSKNTQPSQIGINIEPFRRMRVTFSLDYLMLLGILLLLQSGCGIIVKSPISQDIQSNSLKLVSITISPGSFSLVKGTSALFSATGTYTDGSTQVLTGQVTWISGTPSIATINGTGAATGVSPGETLISARMGNISSSATCLVTQSPLVSIGISPLTSSVAAGVAQSFVANGNLQDGSTVDVTNVANWTSANQSVALVSAPGVITGVMEGSTSITAGVDGIVSNTATLNVTAPILTSIAISPSQASIPVGLTKKFTVTGTYSNNKTQNITGGITWTSLSPAVATINSSGVATGVSVDSTYVQAQVGSLMSLQVSLQVTPPVLISIAITPSAPSVNVGQTEQFKATGTYSDNSTQDLTNLVSWSSSSPANVTIGTKSGVATAVATGSSTISIQTYQGISPSLSPTLTVNNVFYISAIDPPSGLPAGGNTIRVFGYGFTSSSRIFFENLGVQYECTGENLVSPEIITCTAPAFPSTSQMLSYEVVVAQGSNSTTWPFGAYTVGISPSSFEAIYELSEPTLAAVSNGLSSPGTVEVYGYGLPNSDSLSTEYTFDVKGFLYCTSGIALSSRLVQCALSAPITVFPGNSTRDLTGTKASLFFKNASANNLTNYSGVGNQFLFLPFTVSQQSTQPVFQIQSISNLKGPSGGAAAGGSALSVTGIIPTGTKVTIGGNSCTNVAITAGSAGDVLTCNVPAGNVGYADLIITNGAINFTYPSAYRYLDYANVWAVVPEKLNANQASTLDIYGENFASINRSAPTSVMVGSFECSAITLISNEHLQCTFPGSPSNQSPLDIRVEKSDSTVSYLPSAIVIP